MQQVDLGVRGWFSVGECLLTTVVFGIDLEILVATKLYKNIMGYTKEQRGI